MAWPVATTKYYCPVFDRACSGAYTKSKCRCDACKAWQKMRSEQYKKWWNSTDTPERRAKARSRTKAWQSENSERKIEKDRIYRKNNKAKIKETRKRGYDANKAYYKEKATERRARRKEAEVGLSPSEKGAITRLYNKAEKLREEGLDVHVDHVTPLSRGGTHHPDNLAIILAEDNLYKGAREPYLCLVPLAGTYRLKD